jgi:hypothetical protein
MISGGLFERQVRNSLEVIFYIVAGKGIFVGKWTNLVDKTLPGPKRGHAGSPVNPKKGCVQRNSRKPDWGI